MYIYFIFFIVVWLCCVIEEHLNNIYYTPHESYWLYKNSVTDNPALKNKSRSKNLLHFMINNFIKKINQKRVSLIKNIYVRYFYSTAKLIVCKFFNTDDNK